MLPILDAYTPPAAYYTVILRTRPLLIRINPERSHRRHEGRRYSILPKSYKRVAKLLPIMDTGHDEKQVTDLIIAIMHGITAQHIANEPDLPVGEGRFGSLIPAVVSVLDKAWVRK